MEQVLISHGRNQHCHYPGLRLLASRITILDVFTVATQANDSAHFRIQAVQTVMMVYRVQRTAGLVGNVDWAGLGIRVQSHTSTAALLDHLPLCKLRMEHQDFWASSMLGR